MKIKTGDYANLRLHNGIVERVKIVKVLEDLDDPMCIVTFEDGTAGKAWLRDLDVIESSTDQKTFTYDEVMKVLDECSDEKAVIEYGTDSKGKLADMLIVLTGTIFIQQLKLKFKERLNDLK